MAARAGQAAPRCATAARRAPLSNGFLLIETAEPERTTAGAIALLATNTPQRGSTDSYGATDPTPIRLCAGIYLPCAEWMRSGSL